ncbi:hypothetical protein V2H45_12775 [Tumidithrix elongata RA019]|uniref:Uncharacterized protein n=1 Tax=Tumidithrix elongata BACA0141 TaxID=2716417 RepID=A0AAW9Q427_9CYAN|nr:hypothetical protein [Tumidithrix elongata RA019]
MNNFYLASMITGLIVMLAACTSTEATKPVKPFTLGEVIQKFTSTLGAEVSKMAQPAKVEPRKFGTFTPSTKKVPF